MRCIIIIIIIIIVVVVVVVVVVVMFCVAVINAAVVVVVVVVVVVTVPPRMNIYSVELMFHLNSWSFGQQMFSCCRRVTVRDSSREVNPG